MLRKAIELNMTVKAAAMRPGYFYKQGKLVSTNYTPPRLAQGQGSVWGKYAKRLEKGNPLRQRQAASPSLIAIARLS
jgi:hypothetical protein